MAEAPRAMWRRESTAPFTFILQLMVPGPPHLALVIAWAADFNPSLGGEPLDGTSENGTARSDMGDIDSEDDLGGSPFDLCLARCAHPPGKDDFGWHTEIGAMQFQPNKRNCAGY